MRLLSRFFDLRIKEALLNFEWVEAFHRGEIVRKCCLLWDNMSINNGHGRFVWSGAGH